MIQYKTPNLCVYESALYRTTSTVITTDDLTLVVDPNWLPHEIDAILADLSEVDPLRPLYLLFTHSDYDHIIGYQAFPEAKVIASQAFTQRNDAANILQQIRTFDDEYYISRRYPIVYPIADHVISGDEETLQVGDTRLVFWQAPGHTSDGLFAIVEPLGVFIAGDYLSNIEFPYIYFDSRAYERTLEKAEDMLYRYKPVLLVPGHGDATADIGEMELRISQSKEYIETLRESIKKGIPYPTDQLWQKYQFPGSMGRYHEENKTLITKELKKSV